jgi:hypothetical protein
MTLGGYWSRDPADNNLTKVAFSVPTSAESRTGKLIGIIMPEISQWRKGSQVPVSTRFGFNAVFTSHHANINSAPYRCTNYNDQSSRIAGAARPDQSRSWVLPESALRPMASIPCTASASSTSPAAPATPTAPIATPLESRMKTPPSTGTSRPAAAP